MARMMGIATWWGSVGAGCALGVLYAASSMLVTKFALRQNQRVFMIIVFGGMIGRMVVALAAIAAIVLLLPVQMIPFLGSFLVLLILGIGLEIRWLAVRRNETPG